MVTLAIFRKSDKIKIGEFKTKAIDIQKAHYKHVTFNKYGLCATETYYKIIA